MTVINRAIELFNNGDHKCLMFSDLVKGSGIQANQFAIINKHRVAVFDPGGDLTYAALSIEINKHAKLDSVDYVFASHQDPDIIASLPKWLIQTPAQIVTSKLWSRFLPHLVPGYLADHERHRLEERIIALPDSGETFDLGGAPIIAVPAHFLHSVGNFQFFDVTSGILFSGDMGASMVDGDDMTPVTDFEAHIPTMEGFHKRYMTSNRACRFWANMVRQMNVSMIVPQHGKPFAGDQINLFLNWISSLDCGVDLISQQDYQLPAAGLRRAG